MHDEENSLELGEKEEQSAGRGQGKEFSHIDGSGLSRIAGDNFLEPAGVSFALTDGGVLSMNYQGKAHKRVELYRAFPFSFENSYISVREPEGEELGMIRDLRELDAASQEALSCELTWRYFCPVIERVLAIREEFGYLYWEVATDRGYRNFVTRGREESLTLITENRIMITDMTGNRFEIMDIRRLDRRGQQALDFIL